MTETFPKSDEYLDDSANSPHLSPKLIVETPIIPSLTLRLSADGQDARLLRWYDVTQETVNRVGVRSLDFVPDGVVRLIDKDGNEICRAMTKLTDEFDGLPLLLARIEKDWASSHAAKDFWVNASNIIIRSGVPSFVEITPGYHKVARTLWFEFSCHWIAFLSKLKFEAGQLDWADFLSGQQLVVKFIDFYNNHPGKGPSISQPSYQADRNHLRGLLDAARVAITNDQKKHALESLAQSLLSGVSGFEVFPNRLTPTGEIDRWLRNHSSYPQLSMLGSPVLVECKYWQKTVGTDTVGAFIADLDDARLKSGILFSRKPISASAIRRVENFYQRDKGYIIAISEKEVEKVCDGANLAMMIVAKIESIIFQKQQH